jgi:hypothetical protein
MPTKTMPPLVPVSARIEDSSAAFAGSAEIQLPPLIGPGRGKLAIRLSAYEYEHHRIRERSRTGLPRRGDTPPRVRPNVALHNFGSRRT